MLIKKGLVLTVVLCMIIFCFPVPIAIGETINHDFNRDNQIDDNRVIIKIDAKEFSSASGEHRVGEHGVVTNEDTELSYNLKFTSKTEFIMTLEYQAADDSDGRIDRALYINKELPFKKAAHITLSRAYRDEEIKRDGNQNDLVPRSVQKDSLMMQTLQDDSGDAKIILEAGEHTLSIKSLRGSVILKSIILSEEKEIPSYESYLEKHGEVANVDAKTIALEAEKPLEKSHATITPLSNRISADTTPQHPVKVRLNTIGGDRWQYEGQWISWKIDVKKSGYYKIAPRLVQGAYAGGYVSRKLTIDGEVPFKEAENLRFNYTDKFAINELSGYSFYFDEGEHILRMAVVLGDIEAYINRINEVLKTLNGSYRRLLTIIGTSPDLNRDYGLEKMVPDVIESFGENAKILEQIIADIQNDTGLKGDFTSVIKKLSFVLSQMYKDSDKITTSFSNFRDSLSSLGTWVQEITLQPLTLDKIYIVPEGSALPKADSGWLSNLLFQIKAFFKSFFEDYQSLSGDVSEEDKKNAVKVWVTTGFDQAMVIQQLISQSFTPETGIHADMQLVAAGSLLPSVLANIGPDVSLFNGSGDPINYAIRGAVLPLDRFEDLGEIKSRFHESAMTPYVFNGKCYGLPDTISFPMMFYRKDIFEALSIEAPETWEQFYEVIKVLQRNHLQVGFPVSTQAGVSGANLNALNIFLYQSGGSLYSSDYKRSAIDSDLGMNAFKKMTDLFSLYKLPAEYNFATRFRSGEMPLGIVDYSMYNQLTVFAPEIRDLWKMVSIPGTVIEDGTLNHTAPASGTAVMMLKSAKSADRSWEFMKWWTKAETQSRYSAQMESILGPSSKQPVSNIEALSGMDWSAEELSNIRKQMKSLRGTPEVPGGYYTARALDFAFNSVYVDKADPYTAMLDNINDINLEIARKHKEFGLD